MNNNSVLEQLKTIPSADVCKQYFGFNPNEPNGAVSYDANEAAGARLENVSFVRFKNYFVTLDVRQTNEDYLRGTDFFIDDRHGHKIRLDVTLDLDRKIQEGKTTVLQKKEYEENGFFFSIHTAERTGNVVSDFEEPVMVVAVKNDGNYFVKNNIAAVEAYWKLLPQILTDSMAKFMERQFEKEIRKDPLAIGDLRIEEQSDELKRLAISLVSNEDAAELAMCLDNPSEELQLALVRKDPEAIDNIANPTPEAETFATVVKEARHLQELHEHPELLSDDSKVLVDIAVAGGLPIKRALIDYGSLCRQSLAVLDVLGIKPFESEIPQISERDKINIEMDKQKEAEANRLAQQNNKESQNKHPRPNNNRDDVEK